MTSALQDVYMASLSGVEHCQGARPVWFLFPRAKNPTPRETEVCFSVFVGGLFRDFTSARVALLCPNRTHIHCFPARESSQQAPPQPGWCRCRRGLDASALWNSVYQKFRIESLGWQFTNQGDSKQERIAMVARAVFALRQLDAHIYLPFAVLSDF